jgi:hypothetical protein
MSITTTRQHEKLIARNFIVATPKPRPFLLTAA